jgi:adenylosuccinate synthase
MSLVSIAAVIGGQYGSEGKGKVVVRLAQEALEQGCKKIISVRCGGPNAGHTVYVGDKPVVMRQIPSGIVLPGVIGVIPAGAMLDPLLLRKELDNLVEAGMDRADILDRLYVSSFAAVVEPEALVGEVGVGLGAGIGSTQTGTGWTAAEKVMRRARLVGNIATTIPCMELDTTYWMNQGIADAFRRKESMKIIVEGTQGFGLSLHHGNCYPFCTSKDTSASQFISEAGLPMPLVDEVHMVIRTYPIRVGGNSGPIWHEIDWPTVARESGYDSLIEMTSVTKKVRRVGEFDLKLLHRAVMVNMPSHLWVHGMDYISHLDLKKRQYRNLTEKSKNFLDALERWCDAIAPHYLRPKLAGAFTGKGQDDIIDLLPVYADNLDPETGIF